MSDALLTKAEVAEAIATIWDKLISGEGDADTMDLMGIDPDTYNKLKSMLLDKKTDELRKRPIEHVYVEYMIWQMQNIGTVTSIINEARADKQHNAAIAAVRTRADLYDRLIGKGQECGIFKKAPEQHRIGVTAMVTDLTSDEIKVEFATAVSVMTKMMRKFGDGDITAAPIDTIHYGEVLEEEDHAVVIAPRAKGAAPVEAPRARSRTGKAKTSKGSKHARGRRAFKVSGGA
jgi:hypothetical protein